MVYHDESLKKMQEKVARRHKLDRQIQDLRVQKERLREQVAELDSARIREQEDVDKLEGRSLAAFFYNVIGKREEQLDIERQEAYAAAVKYDAAARELDDVDYDLQQALAEFSKLVGAETAYVDALNAKADALKAVGGPAGQQILKLEEELADLESVKKEISEAIQAGQTALASANHAHEQLEHAGDLATWDMLGGGLLVDMAKHDALDKAQENVEQLQRCLSRFRTELADIQLSADISVKLDDFTHFADYFFDGLFMDWSVADKISRSNEQMNRIIRQLETTITRLVTMRDNTDRNIRAHQSDIDNLVMNTQL